MLAAIGSTSTAAPFDVNVAKATGSNARTIAETWAQASALEGKSVTIHGKVVKYNEGVMGKNWIHLQDGSGDVGQGTNDLTVTSTDATSVGETVSIAGTVHTNRDFGSGYVYRVIVEDAQRTVLRAPLANAGEESVSGRNEPHVGGDRLDEHCGAV